MIVPQGTPANTKCQPLAREAGYPFNQLPQTGLIDTLIEAEAEYTFNQLPQTGLIDTLTRSETGIAGSSILKDTLTRSEMAQLAFYASNDTLNRSESMSKVNT